MIPKISVCIPSHNNEETIADTIESVIAQNYPLKEIIVCDDASTDGTVGIVKKFPQVRLVVNPQNLGIGLNLIKLMDTSHAKYLFYLCADDVITHPEVLSDYVKAFDENPRIGILGRFCYYFMDGKKGSIGTCRDRNILTNSCCPSGIGLRNSLICEGTKRIFIEMPFIISQYLKQYEWSLIEYDTVACRYSPGINTGTKSSYYTESPTQNWIDLLGENYQDFPVFITLKNRAPHLLWREICLHVKNDKNVLVNWQFYMYALMSMMPRSFLKWFSIFYRNHITRRSSQIIERPKNV